MDMKELVNAIGWLVGGGVLIAIAVVIKELVVAI